MEKFVGKQGYREFRKDIISLEEFLGEMELSPTRYKDPRSLKDRMRLATEKELLEFSSCVKDSLLGIEGECSSFPLRWKKIFSYLYRKKIIRHPFPLNEELFNDEPKVTSLRLYGNPSDQGTDGHQNPSAGGYSRGVGLDFEEAISKAVGEFLERYPLTLYKEKDLLIGSVANLKKRGKRFIRLDLLDQFLPWQKEKFPKLGFDENSMFRWTEGKSLMTDQRTFIPAQLVFWNYRFMEGEPVLQQPITNGAGGMFTRTEAILSGLYELIQRDAFFIYWFNRIAPSQVDADSLEHQESRRILAMCQRYGLEAHILNITSDFGIPTFATVLLDRGGIGPAVTLGGGCGQDPEQAIARSLTEAIGVRHWLRERMFHKTFHLPEKRAPFSDAFSQDERLIYWGNQGMQETIQFFLKGQKKSLRKMFPDVLKKMTSKQEFSSLKEIFARKGKQYEIFCYEVRHEILDALGYSSVKLVVPALIPLYFTESQAPLGKNRIREACRILGYTPSEQPNPLPHPFP